jgi:NAD(P)-dependent dehydrogenase (short-subunit alcohol dehydrogenase family)
MMDNLFDIEYKNILVTGASSGIGKEIAIRLNSLGANVIITGRDEERLKETRDSLIYHLGIPAETHTCDLSKEDDIKKMVTKLPRLDGVVFCAGVVEYYPIKFINAEKINNIFSVNLNSQIILTQQLSKNKKLKPNGSLVYISSIASKIGVSGTSLYAASKAGLNGFVKVAASELSSQKIRANSICPGIIQTPMAEKAQNVNDDLAKDYPLGLGETIDVVGPCVFLLSDASKWITGTELILDGGLTLA